MVTIKFYEPNNQPLHPIRPALLAKLRNISFASSKVAFFFFKSFFRTMTISKPFFNIPLFLLYTSLKSLLRRLRLVASLTFLEPMEMPILFSDRPFGRLYRMADSLLNEMPLLYTLLKSFVFKRRSSLEKFSSEIIR